MNDDAEGDPDGVDLRLDAFELTQRARDASGTDGVLALPHTAHWPIFPFDVSGLHVRALEDPVLPEPPRRGENAEECSSCESPDPRFVWTNERWRVGMSQEPLALPGVMLHPRQHLDLGDLTEQMAAEMGVLLVRIQNTLAEIEGVARVHIYKWGDGGAHLHVLVVGRPLGMMQLRGMFLTTWMHALPPLPLQLWAGMRLHVGEALRALPPSWPLS